MFEFKCKTCRIQIFVKICIFLLLSAFSTSLSLSAESNKVTLVINEFMADNDTFIQDPNGDYDDWIEIYNYGDEAINMAGMFLTDNLYIPNKWQISADKPVETTISTPPKPKRRRRRKKVSDGDNNSDAPNPSQ